MHLPTPTFPATPTFLLTRPWRLSDLLGRRSGRRWCGEVADRTRRWPPTFGRSWAILLRRLGSGSLPRGRRAQVSCLLFCAGMERVVRERRRRFPTRRASRRQWADVVKRPSRPLAFGYRGRFGQGPGEVLSHRVASRRPPCSAISSQRRLRTGHRRRPLLRPFPFARSLGDGYLRPCMLVGPDLLSRGPG
jgi:hypothetical protein